MEKQEIIQPDKLKDVLIARTALQTGVPEEIVEKVISFQFKDVRDQIRKADRVRISGFGTFMLCRRKLEHVAGKLLKRIQKTEKLIETGSDTDIKRKNAIEKLPELKAELEVMQKRLNSL